MAAQLRKLHLGIGQIFSRDMTVQCDAQHPCWKAAHFLPCTRPPDVMRLHRSSNRAMSVRDVFALVILMGLYLSTASGHQKAYKELLAYIDAGNALTLDDVQHAMIRYSRSNKPRAFSTRKPADVRRPEARRVQCSNCCPRCCSSVKSDAACNRLCPRCCDTRGRTPDPSSRTSSRPGSPFTSRLSQLDRRGSGGPCRPRAPLA